MLFYMTCIVLLLCIVDCVESRVNIALFIQATMISDSESDSMIWADIFNCVSNVGEAKKLAQNFDLIPWENVTRPDQFSFDIYISLPHGVGPTLKPSLKSLGASHVHVTEVPRNKGLDIRPFLNALRLASRKDAAYDYFLKIHSKTDEGWRRQALDSMCGSPAQVLTVMNAFREKEKNIGIVVPQGLVIKKSIPVNHLFRPLRKYFTPRGDTTPPTDVFNPVNVKNMKSLYFNMFHKELDPDERKYVCNAGTMFWAKYDSFQATAWHKILPYLRGKWTEGYVQDGGMEHAMERLFVTIPYINGVNIAEIIPAPKPIGIYFPQYHGIPENDAIHGKGFTEWTLLKPSPVDFLAKPLSPEKGGLGYYDLTDINVRRRQGELARLAGLHGFMYYHYWFAGNSSFEYKNPVMGRVPELMLQDGEPNLPFMFSWANEPWTSTWSGGDGRVFLPQNYGGEREWRKHFEYLLPFFKHHNYIRVDGKPVFTIYRIGLMKNKLAKMVHLWRKLAVDAGLRGIHIIYTLNNFVHKDKVFERKLQKECDASFQFFPTIAAAYPIANATSMSNVDTQDEKKQYWGGFAGFSNRVRRADEKSWTRLVSPQEFRDSMRFSFEAMGRTLPATPNQVNVPNLFFLTAWNEWNEQAQLEPSDKYGYAYLSTIKATLEELPMQLIL